MGYRLDVSEIKQRYTIAGGKLYGYMPKRKLRKLKSYQWLKENGHITGKETWDYGHENICILNGDEFRDFWTWYAIDWKDTYGEYIQMTRKELESYNNDKDKVISWG